VRCKIKLTLKFSALKNRTFCRNGSERNEAQEAIFAQKGHIFCLNSTHKFWNLSGGKTRPRKDNILQLFKQNSTLFSSNSGLSNFDLIPEFKFLAAKLLFWTVRIREQKQNCKILTSQLLTFPPFLKLNIQEQNKIYAPKMSLLVTPTNTCTLTAKPGINIRRLMLGTVELLVLLRRLKYQYKIAVPKYSAFPFS